MAGMVENLNVLLEQQYECYKALNELAQIEKASLLDNSVETLKKVVHRKEEFTGRVIGLDRQTRALLRDLALVLGIRKKDFAFEEVVALCEAEEKERLQIQRELILKEILELKKQNALNKELIEQSLELINFSITALHSHKEPQTIGYVHLGEISTQEVNAFFDKRQ